MSAMTTRVHEAEEKVMLDGAERSRKDDRYDLIPPEVLQALAARYGLGAVKYEPNQWKRGGVEFVKSCVNHMLAHHTSFLQNGPDWGDDDIGAMLWNIGALAWFRANKPEVLLMAWRELKHPKQDEIAQDAGGVL
jgi:hypothetical protein